MTSTAPGSPNDEIAIEAVRAVTGRQVSAGPEASGLTRSPWGPERYRASVDSVVIVVVENKGIGSGVVVRPNCQVVTNWHVVEDAPSADIVFRHRVLAKTVDRLTRKDTRAKVVRASQPQDLALLQLERCPTGVKYLALEDPDRVEVGQDVFAIGHPEGLFWTYTEGVISQIRPRFRWETLGRTFQATLIQTQTPVSYGSSGGPLINRDGKIVGIVSNALPVQAGFNFAIAVHDLSAFLGR